MVQKAIVVGAGVGGLSCAIDLAATGMRVSVLERAVSGGGKASIVRLGEAEVAAGPTVLTMVWVFDELFEAAGASFRSEISLDRASLLARHAWNDGTRLDLHADRERSADAIGEVFGAREARAYRSFCEDGRRIFEVAESTFLRAQRPTIGSVARLGPAGLKILTRLDSHRSMWRALEQRFASPRLVQLFGRYATYCGSSPFEAPATLNLIAHVEADGVYRARGGMNEVVAALERLARKLGVEILYDHPVDRIVVERGRATGVVAREAFHACDAVVFNGDVSALGAGLLGGEAARVAKVTARDARSLSAVTWQMVARPVGFPLVHHNVFFSDDYAREFKTLFGEHGRPLEPTVYVCAQDRGDEEIEREGERLLVLVNAPATGDDPTKWDESETQRWRTVMASRLRAVGLDLAPETSALSTPADYHRRFPGTGGALYGPRSSGMMSALARSPAATKISGLFLAGGSVHPGPGVPMAALSGRLAATRVREDLGSTARSRPAATSGTT